MRAARAALGLVVAVVAAGGGCLQVLGYEDPTLYVADAGTSTTSTTTGSGTAPVCQPGSVLMSCYSGPPSTEGTGLCKAGEVRCKADGSGPEACTGEVTPQPETCADTDDNNCDGYDCVQWAGTLGNLQDQVVKAVSVDSAGNVFVVGTFHGSIPLSPSVTLTTSSQAAFLVKLDPKGVPLWGVKIDGATGTTTASSVTADSFGEVAIGGVATGPVSVDASGTIGPGAYVAKFDDTGKPLWARALTSQAGAWDSVNGLGSTADGDVVAVGSVSSSVDFGDGPIAGPSPSGTGFGFVARLKRATGSGKVSDKGWGTVLCGGASECYANQVAVDGQGRLLLAGRFKGSISMGTGATMFSPARAIFFGRLTGEGVPDWQRYVAPASGVVTVSSLTTDPAGNATLSGSFSGTTDFGGGSVDPPGGSAGFVVHYDDSDAYKWAKILQNGTARAVAADKSGNIFLAGDYSGSLDLGGTTPLSGGGLFVAKLSLKEDLVWSRGYAMALVSGSTMGAAVERDDPVIAGSLGGQGNIDGISLQSSGGADVFVAKLSQ
jgi:hypothetical protein